MKNLFIIPTDKPSRLAILNSGKLNFGAEFISSSNSKAQNIYITSDEEIKDGDWCCDRINEIFKVSNLKSYKYQFSKIILTTDQDLIKDGVQAIDDEFLKWFVKNSSCEDVEIVSIPRCCGRCYVYDDLCVADKCCDDHHEYGCEICYGKRIDYKIIIQKEEPKQETLKNHYLSRPKPLIDISRIKLDNHPDLHKQETLEEAYNKIYKSIDFTEFDFASFAIGAKWQQQNSYSEEEVISILMKVYEDIGKRKIPNPVVLAKWFEKFKKK